MNIKNQNIVMEIKELDECNSVEEENIENTCEETPIKETENDEEKPPEIKKEEPKPTPDVEPIKPKEQPKPKPKRTQMIKTRKIDLKNDTSSNATTNKNKNKQPKKSLGFLGRFKG